MRRIMLGMSQEKLGEALGLTFQQVQKTERHQPGRRQPPAADLRNIAGTRVVSVRRRTERRGEWRASPKAPPRPMCPISSQSEGYALTRAFTRIADSKMRRSIVELVEQIASRDGPDQR